MDYLTKATLCTTVMSFLGNRHFRSIVEKKDLTDSLFKFTINDAISIGIGTFAPLLISGFLKESPNKEYVRTKAYAIHVLGSCLISFTTSAILLYNDYQKKQKAEFEKEIK